MLSLGICSCISLNIFYFLGILLFRFVLAEMPKAVHRGAQLSCHVRLQQMPKQEEVDSQWHSVNVAPLRMKSIMPADVACSWGRWITNCHNKGGT